MLCMMLSILLQIAGQDGSQETVVDSGHLRKMPVQADDLRSLLLPTAAIPSFPVADGPNMIMLNLGGDKPDAKMRSTIMRTWRPAPGPGTSSLIVSADYHETSGTASHALKARFEPQTLEVPPERIVRFAVAQVRGGFPSGPIGEESFVPKARADAVTFRRGPVVISVSGPGSREVLPGIPGPTFTEGVARSHDYNLVRMFSPDSALKVRVRSEEVSGHNLTLLYFGEPWGPVSIFESAGVNVREGRGTGAATITNDIAGIELLGFHTKYTVNGDERNFAMPVMYWDERIIVPLRPVAEALGLRVTLKDGVVMID